MLKAERRIRTLQTPFRPTRSFHFKPYPSSNSPRIMAMADGTKLDVLLRRADGWWFVKVWPRGEQGWAFRGQGNKAYILCCASDSGAQTDSQPVAKDVTDFTCEQLWFGRNGIFKEARYCFKTARAIASFGNAGCRYDDVSSVPLSADNQAIAERIRLRTRRP